MPFSAPTTSFGSSTPANGGQLTATTPLIVTVNNTASTPFCIWLKFVNDARAYVVWDSGTNAFYHPFTGSTVDLTTDFLHPVFSLVQTGGWQDEIETLNIGGAG